MTALIDLDRIAIALDLPTVGENLRLVRTLEGHAAWFKVGMRLFYTAGSESVFDAIRASGAKLFLDLKLHDIPKTVGDAAAALERWRPQLLTVHASGGREMISAAVSVAAEYECRIVAVTVLTSLDATDLAPYGSDLPLSRIAALWTEAATDAGAAGVVCSGQEVAMLRASFPEAFLVTPGIRLAGGARGDQKRVVTPRKAIDDGSSLLVVGRAIYGADDPRAAFDRVREG